MHKLRFRSFNENLISRNCSKFCICMLLRFIKTNFSKPLAAFPHHSVNRQLSNCEQFSNVEYCVSLLSMETWLAENDKVFICIWFSK